MQSSIFLAVRTQVGFQVGALQEAPPTDVTPVRSLSRVAPDVLLQMPAVGETLAAQRAAEGLLARVDPGVDLQIAFASALLAADEASVRLQPGVDGHVLLQRARAPEQLPAQLAALWVLVRSERRAEAPGGLEGSSARDASVPRVSSDGVAQLQVAGGKGFTAQRAHVVGSGRVQAG